MCVGARVVTEPDAVVADNTSSLLGDAGDAEDLASGALHLLELRQEVPEAALGNNLVGGKDGHLVQRLLGLGLCGQLAPDDLVLPQLHKQHRDREVERERKGREERERREEGGGRRERERRERREREKRGTVYKH